MGEAKRRRQTGDDKPRAKRKIPGAWLLAGGFALFALAVVGLFHWLTDPTISPIDDLPRAAVGAPPFPAELDRHGVSVGDPNAPVVVREFSDYQCPACARFADIKNRFKREYVESGRARVVFFDFPLSGHRNAVPAAMAARCAGDQQAYWPMHDTLFARQSRWSELADPLETFAGFADSLNLDRRLFERCMRTQRHRAAVEQSLEVARRLRVAGTPTVTVDNIRLTQPGWYQLAGVVERQLEAAREAGASAD
jgi:protein-disulfide isomerase